MARLMRYMFNMNGRKLFSTVHIKLGKPILYSFPPPVIEAVFEDDVTWQCGINVVNANAFNEGTVFYYTTDGNDPTDESLVLSEDTVIDKNCTIKIIGRYEDKKTIFMSADIGKLTIDGLRNGMAIFRIRG